MDFFSTYKYYIEDMADPRLANWPLMSSPIPITLILIIYWHIVTKSGPKFMENKKPFSLKTILQAYNVFQIISCIVILAALVKYGWFTKLSPFVCHLVDYSDDPMAVGMVKVCYSIVILKVIELIETVFFVMRKKYNQVSGLHLYHHISTVMVAWVGTKYVAGGMATFPAVINTFVHLIMYTYYLLSTLGPEWQKKLSKWKPKLTIIQMIQFCIILAHATMPFRDDCKFPKQMAYVFIPNVIIVFYMFYDFYKKAYLKSK